MWKPSQEFWWWNFDFFESEACRGPLVAHFLLIFTGKNLANLLLTDWWGFLFFSWVSQRSEYFQHVCRRVQKHCDRREKGNKKTQESLVISKELSGTGDSQRDSRESIRANHSQSKPYFYSASGRFARITRISNSHESPDSRESCESIRANHATKVRKKLTWKKRLKVCHRKLHHALHSEERNLLLGLRSGAILE